MTVRRLTALARHLANTDRQLASIIDDWQRQSEA